MEFEIDTEREAFGLEMPAHRLKTVQSVPAGKRKLRRTPLRQAIFIPGANALS